MAHDLYEHGQTKDLYVPPYNIAFIRSWIRDMKMRMLKLGAETESNMRSENEDVVGLEEQVQLLLRTKIFKKRGYRSTLLIKGMAGIGKTTLARQLYNHAGLIDDGFDRRAWVCVSSDLSKKEVLMKLIQQVVDDEEFQRDSLLEKMERADNKSLQEMLCQHLQEMRYFIVLDGNPNQLRLESILNALRGGKQGILLFTSHTRNMDIFVDSVYDMEFLDSDKSWQLFLKTINCGNKLRSELIFPKHLENKGKQVLTKCGGLPLAIKEVGKQLAEKRRSGSEWEQLLESIDFGSTLDLLEVFYQKLNPKVKSCFLHMAFYKENTTMREEKLTQIWVAGGVISKNDYYKSYFRDLINESIIAVKDKSTEYVINAVLQRLSIKKAEEEIGFEILSYNGNNPPSPSPRRRVIICSRDKFNYSTDQDGRIDSLFFHGG